MALITESGTCGEFDIDRARFGPRILPCGDVSRLLELEEFETLLIPRPMEEGMKDGVSTDPGVEYFRSGVAPLFRSEVGSP